MASLTNSYPANTYKRLLQFRWAGNSGVSEVSRLQDGEGNDVSLWLGANSAAIGNNHIAKGYFSLSCGNNNAQSGYCNLQAGENNRQSSDSQYSFQGGNDNSQAGIYSLQMGTELTQGSALFQAIGNVQFGSDSTQNGSHNFQMGDGNSQQNGAIYNFQFGQELQSSHGHCFMFGDGKTSTLRHRAYFAITGGLWMRPSPGHPTALESGMLWYHNVSGWCCYLSGQARRFLVA